MLVMGIETATSVTAVAMAGEEGLIAEHLINNVNSHCANLLPMVRDLMEETGTSPSDLEALAVSSGPGSFTGLRIGLATARTLARFWRLRLVAVPTLEALAFPFAGSHALVVSALTARKGEVYAAIYRATQGRPLCLAGPAIVKPPELVELCARFDGPVLLTGEGAPTCLSCFGAAGRDVQISPPQNRTLRAGAVAGLGLVLLRSGEGSDPLAVLPRYIRLPEAELVWREKHGEGKC